MTYQELKDRLSKCELTLEKIKNGTYSKSNKDLNQTVEKLTILKESLQKQLAEADKGIVYTDDEKKAKDLADDGINVKLSDEIKENVKFSVDETKAIARKVGEAVAKSLHNLGDEVAHMKAKNIEPNSFEIYIEYKNDNEDQFSFYIKDDSLHLVDFSFDKELVDVGVKPSGEAIVHVDHLSNELQKHFKSLNEERAADKYNVNVFGYQTKYYKICPGAKAFMEKLVDGKYGDKNQMEVVRLAKLHDLLFYHELMALKDSDYAKKILGIAKSVAKGIQDQVENMGIPVQDVDYVNSHIDKIADATKAEKRELSEKLDFTHNDGGMSFADNENIVGRLSLDRVEDFGKALAKRHFPKDPKGRQQFFKDWMTAWRESGYDDSVNEAPSNMYYIKVKRTDKASLNGLQDVIETWYSPVKFADIVDDDGAGNVIFYLKKSDWDPGMEDDIMGNGVRIVDTNMPLSEADDKVKDLKEDLTVVGHTPEEEKRNAEELVTVAKKAGRDAKIKYDGDRITGVDIGAPGLGTPEEVRAVQDRQFDDYDKNKPKDDKGGMHKPARLRKLTVGGKTYEIGDFDPNDDGRIMSIEKYPNGYYITGGVYTDYGDGDEPKEGYGYALSLDGKEMDEEDLEGMYEGKEKETDDYGRPHVDPKGSRTFLEPDEMLPHNRFKKMAQKEDTDVGHQDDEPDMLQSTAFETAQYAAKLVKKLQKYDNFDGEVDFPNWWQAKLILAKDYMQKAYHYLASEEAQPAIDQLALEENIDKVAGGIPYKREGNKIIISEPLDDATKERIMKRAKEHGHHAAPNMAGGVTIMAKEGKYKSDAQRKAIYATKAEKGMDENRFLAASMADLEQVIRNLAHTGEMSEDEAIELAIRKLEAMLDGRDDLDEGVAKTQKALDLVISKMKELAKLYKAGDKSVVNQLKDLTAKKKKLEAMLDSDVADIGRDQELTEGRGDLESITSIIDDRAAESGFDVKDEAIEVIEAIADYYKLGNIDFEFQNEAELSKSERSKLKDIVKQLKMSVKGHGNQAKYIDSLVKKEAAPGYKHDCAAKVVHEKYGAGTCIPEKHTLIKEGDKFVVTHYDVLFESGRTVEYIPVDELEIKTQTEHWHKGYKKKKK